MRRTLSLSKETLTELTPRELGSVAGGAITYYCTTAVAITYYCTLGDGCRIPTDHCRFPTDGCGLSEAMDPCVTYGCV